MKKFIKITGMLGKNINEEKEVIPLYIYDDRSVEKKKVVE